MRARLMAAVAFCGLLFMLVLTVPVLLVVRDSAVGAADDELLLQTSQLGVFMLSQPTTDQAAAFADELAAGSAVIFTIADDTGAVIGPDTPRFPVAKPPPPFDEQPSSPADLQPSIRVVDGARVASLGVFDGTRPWRILGRIPDAQISENVRSRIGTIELAGLAALSLSLLAAWILAGRIARSVGKAVTAAEQLGDGARDVEVPTKGPRELVTLGSALRRLSAQIDGLLQSERHRSAEISHRLRTPLTAVELAAESLISRHDGVSGSAEAEILLERLDNLESELDQVIIDTRAAAGTEPAPLTDLRQPVQANLQFWLPLAAEQQRAVTISVPEQPVPVLVTVDDLTTVIDSWVGNIFRHTRAGVGFDVRVEILGDAASLTIADHGSGAAASEDAPRTTGSTGIGHTVTAAIAERAGGSVRIDTSGDGTVVTLTVPLAHPAAAHPAQPPERSDTR